MIAARAALVAALTVVAVAGGAGSAGADGEAILRNAEHRFELELRAGPWQAIADDDEHLQTPVAGFRSGDGAIMAITRIDYPNPDAWRGKDHFFDEVEAGVEGATSDYRRLHRRTFKLGRVPAMDLTFRSRREGGDGEVVLTRFLFFRTYSMVLTVAVPGDAYRSNRRSMRALVDSFRPYFE